MMKITNIQGFGLIPLFFNPYIDESWRDQISDSYSFGGGWNSFEGFSVYGGGKDGDGKYSLCYPGDPVMEEIGRIQDKDNGRALILFPHSWVMYVVLEEGKEPVYDIARID